MIELDDGALLQTHSDALCTTLQNGEAVLLHLGRQTYFTLNATGLFIWRLLDGKHELAEIARRVASEFRIDNARAAASVKQLLEGFLAEELVVPAGDASQRPSGEREAV